MTKTRTSDKIADSLDEDQKNAKKNFDDVFSDLKDEMTNFVQNNPTATVAIAAGVGFLLARLIYKRRT